MAQIARDIDENITALLFAVATYNPPGGHDTPGNDERAD